MLELNLEPLPTGGIVVVYARSDDPAPWTLTRTPGKRASDTLTLFEGDPYAPGNDVVEQPFFIDIGDGLNGPLSEQVSYTYILTTPNGTVTATTEPANEMVLQFDDLLTMFVRILQAGMNALAPPPGGGKKPTVYISMPLTGTPPLPAISVNEDLLRQSLVPLGHGINTDVRKNQYFISELVKRRYRVTVLVSTTQERTYYENAVIGLFKAVLIPLLTEIGQDVSSDFQAASSQVVDPAPGFYFCDMMLEFEGCMPLKILTNYPVVTDFEISANGELLGP